MLAKDKDKECIHMKQPRERYADRYNTLVNDMIDDYVLELQKIRIKKNISQYKLAKITGLSHTTIMRIENFATTPTLKALLKISLALDADFNILLNEEELSNNSSMKSPIIQNGSSVSDFHMKELLPICINKDEEEPFIFLDPIQEVTHISDIPKYYLKECSAKNTGITGELALSPTDLHQIADTIAIPSYIEEICYSIDSLISFKIDASNYLDNVRRLLQEYHGILCQYSLKEQFINTVEHFSNSMILVLQEYYLGQHTSAYNIFAEAMGYIDIDYLFVTLSPAQKFYRARLSPNQQHFQKDDFFHIPFEKRTDVSSQRYSFPGLPCLYVGTSKAVCFEELGCDERDAAVAEIRLHDDKPCRILDLTKIFDTAPNRMNISEQMHFEALFPLVFLCSTEIETKEKENYKSPIFRPDYVIPQLLLEYILDKTTFDKSPILGIKYYSVKEDFFSSWLNGDERRLAEIINVAIPARSDGSKGYCSILSELFYVDHITGQASGEKRKAFKLT